MVRRNPSGHLPVIAESAYIDRTAIICGKVVIGEHVFVGPYAGTDLSKIPRVTNSATEFSEDVARTNVDLVRGYKALQNEF